MAHGSRDLDVLEVEIDRIRSLDLDALRARWRSTFGAIPPKGLTKDLIARMISYRLQEETFGGLDRATIKLLESLARGDRSASEMKRHLRPGTVLVREYQGERHTVTVVAEGFVWREGTYGSLSTIARAITGTAWNGPRFFGLRSGRAEKQEDGSRTATADGGGARSKRRIRRADPMGADP